MTLLQKNSLDDLDRTLQDLADPARQEQYKKEVPFVHVPRELIVQWDGHARLLREVPWFRELFADDQRDRLLAFDDWVTRFRKLWHGDMPDVPKVLDVPEWRALGAEAVKVLAFLREIHPVE